MHNLPLGYSDFKRIREDNLYYVDKTLFIKEVIDNAALIQLIPRPRRFGKTLNLSTLNYFFNREEAEENRELFEGLGIMEAGERYTRELGKYPVVFLTFKDAKTLQKQDCFTKIYQTIRKLYKQHEYLLTSHFLDQDEELYFKEILSMKAPKASFEASLENLLIFLYRYHREKVIILIDEYDAPIHGGYHEDYYTDIISFMRNLLSGGLKDTDRYLRKAVLTGILRVAQESIFSGLNNPGVYTLLDSTFAPYFGFTEAETEQILEDFGREGKYEEVKQWYNGYVFGAETLYNPWSIINFTASADGEFKPYWINTSDNKLIHRLLTEGGKELKEELVYLMEGKAIDKPITENIVFPEIETSEDLLWSFLLFGGYLKQTAHRRIHRKNYYSLSIPNEEVAYTYTNIIETFFSGKINKKFITGLMTAARKGEIKPFIKFFKNAVLSVLSYYDMGQEPENVYHAFTAGLLIWLYDTHHVRSNRESGYGRADILLIPRDAEKYPGYIIEFKTFDEDDEKEVEETITAAFNQIEEKKYETELVSLGVKKIHKLAMAFKGKEVVIRQG